MPQQAREGGARRSNNRQAQAVTSSSSSSGSTVRRSAGSAMLERGRSKMRHSQNEATNSTSIRSSRSSARVSSSGSVPGSVASAARRRSSREAMVDMKAMLQEAEAVKAMLDEAEAANAEAEADLRGTFARSKGKTGSSSSLVNSVDDHPLMDVLGDNDNGNNYDDSLSVGDIDQMLSDANQSRLNRHKARNYTARTSSSRHLSGSRSLDGSSVSGLTGHGMSSRMSTRDPRSRRRRSITRPIDDDDDDDDDDDNEIPPSSQPPQASPDSSAHYDHNSVSNAPSRSSRSTSSPDDTSISVGSGELINLKVELASTKANNEILQAKARVLTEENCMLRTELCSAKASEAELKQMVANLEKQVMLLKKQSNGQEREGSYRRRDSNASTGSGFSAFGKAVETLLGSEINGAKDSDYEVPLGASVGVPADKAQEQTPSLARRLCRSLSKESLDEGALNFEGCLTSEDTATQQQQSQPSTRPRRARRRGSNSSNFSVDDAVTVQCELNNLADDNDELREKNALLEAERDRLRERLDQMMAVSAATASAIPTNMGAIGDNAEYELHGKDFEQAYNDSAEPQGPPSSIRDFMTKVSSMRNNINGSNPTTAQVPAGRYRRSMGSNSQASLPPSRFVDLKKRASIDSIADSMLSVDSLLWDSFNNDNASLSRGAGIVSSFTSVPEIDDEAIDRQEVGTTSESVDDESDSMGLVEKDDRLGLDDYAYVNPDALRLRQGSAA